MNSDQFRTAVKCATCPSSVAYLCNDNINIVKKLYTQPVTTNTFPPPPPFHQQYSLPGHICTTIKHVNRHKGAGRRRECWFYWPLHRSRPGKHPTHQRSTTLIFDKIYQNQKPDVIKNYSTDVYLFCLHKDANDKSKLCPRGIPTAIWPLIASHVAHTFKEKFTRNATIQQRRWNTPWNEPHHLHNASPSQEIYQWTMLHKHATHKSSSLFWPHKPVQQRIPTHFCPHYRNITTLFYDEPGTVHHKWAGETWSTLSTLECLCHLW